MVDEHKKPELLGEEAAHQLQSHEHAELMDAIDRLRKESIDADISIPQVVVCGDQSSGKSSLLEAIVQIPFPAGSGTCTLFPTEIIMRNAPLFSLKISISPAADRTQQQRQHLGEFQWPATAISRSDFQALYRAVSTYLRAFEPDRGFWYDRLRVDITGPNQRHMSCIDLPGLFLEASHRLKQSSEDVEKIRNLTGHYIKNPRTVVLAVVSATSDFQTQLISNLVSTSGNVKDRTLGVITKPDRVRETDDALRNISLAQNEELHLGLGWHVVKNLSHEEPDQSPAHRDAEEKSFFWKSPWVGLSRKDVGIANLRKKLSQSLFGRMKSDLPDLITEMNAKLASSRNTLEQLGPARETAKDHRVYLVGITNRLQAIVHAAMEGDHTAVGAEGFFDDVESKQLRNVITRNGNQYVETMRQNGSLFVIEEDTVHGIRDDLCSLSTSSKLRFAPPCDVGFSEEPCLVSFKRYCADLTRWMQNNRGKDLRGLVKRDSIQAVFRQQSTHWKVLTRAHVDNCRESALDFLRSAVMHVAGPHTGQNLMATYVYPAFEVKHERLEEKLSELLWPHQKCHLMTENPAWMKSLQNVVPQLQQTGTNKNEYRSDNYIEDSADDDSDRSEPELGTQWKALAVERGYSDDSLIAAETMDRADVYYEIAMNNFIDNVASLAIERCLLNDMQDIVALETIAGLTDSELETIAGEPQDAREERARVKAQIAALEEAVRTCRRYASQPKDRRAVNSTPLRRTLGRDTPSRSSPSPESFSSPRPQTPISGYAS